MSDDDLRTWLVICDDMVGLRAARDIAPLPPAALLLVPGSGVRGWPCAYKPPRRRGYKRVVCPSCGGTGRVREERVP